MSIGDTVLTPRPISGFFDEIVTGLSGAIHTQAFNIAAPSFGLGIVSASASPCRPNVRIRPPPPSALAFKNWRREVRTIGLADCESMRLGFVRKLRRMAASCKVASAALMLSNRSDENCNQQT